MCVSIVADEICRNLSLTLSRINTNHLSDTFEPITFRYM